MGIRINTNIAALNTRRHLANNTALFNKSMEKLSSGLRINRAADDAAGLAISEGLKSDIRALEQASRNASDGISLVQTAEGALDEVSTIILRLRELATQSANGTLSDSERGYLNAEYTALTAEVTRIATSTQFNGTALLSGSGGTVNIQVGIGTAGTDRIEILLNRNMSATGLTLTTGVDTAANATTALGQIEAAATAVNSARSAFGAVQNRLESSVRNINNTAENLAAANSRIRDVDMALETSRLTSFQILQQAGVSVLAQANMTSGLALSLLG